MPRSSNLTGWQWGGGCHGKCPVEVDEAHPPPLRSQYPGRIHRLVCERIEVEISRGSQAFEVKGEVGHVIVQPCVFVCAWACLCLFLLNTSSCLARRASPSALSDVTQKRCLRALSGFSAVDGNEFTSTFPMWGISKMTEMLLCPDGIRNDELVCRRHFYGSRHRYVS